MLFKKKNSQYEYLRKKWVAHNKSLTNTLFDKHLRRVAATSLGGLMLLSTPSLPIPNTQATLGEELIEQPSITAGNSKNALLAAELVDKLPDEMRALSNEEEATIAGVIQKDLNIKVAAELESKRLNRSYGVIGGEQHLYRYPGDTVYAHAKTAQDWAMYGSSGIAPGLGAWGYFAPSKEQMTEEDENRERYYLAVQTFLSAGFAERSGEYRDFFKYRKMLVVNPKTGQACVAVIGDAGPSPWTGKHLGGSPEVMHEVGLAGGPRKGPVLYFFVDDPEGKVPLGPVKIEEIVK